jgi:hypothetical protein
MGLTTDNPDLTGYYGSYEGVKARLQVTGQPPEDALMLEALSGANAWVDINLGKHGLTVPSQIPPAIKQAATHYATAEALQPLFNSNSDENTGVDFYMEQAQAMLTAYIDQELKKTQDAEADPYIVSQSHKSTRYSLEEIIL